jgi:hypothetical protein
MNQSELELENIELKRQLKVSKDIQWAEKKILLEEISINQQLKYKLTSYELQFVHFKTLKLVEEYYKMEQKVAELEGNLKELQEKLNERNKV